MAFEGMMMQLVSSRFFQWMIIFLQNPLSIFIHFDIKMHQSEGENVVIVIIFLKL